MIRKVNEGAKISRPRPSKSVFVHVKKTISNNVWRLALDKKALAQQNFLWDKADKRAEWWSTRRVDCEKIYEFDELAETETISFETVFDSDFESEMMDLGPKYPYYGMEKNVDGDTLELTLNFYNRSEDSQINIITTWKLDGAVLTMASYQATLSKSHNPFPFIDLINQKE